ncbi:putative endonuclease [Methanosarcina sp. Kolksee]|uniref:restriction endonuclease n=1 Tax=Methanosarcina sp. Kolksee TaxID=1434099 RepID=UPI000615B1F4|nr:restriction endonuclease [Methanosarcina sp. Kolksee]AKB48816.1 putative endonuclease [Methanosarcina sp. Kolksee]
MRTNDKEVVDLTAYRLDTDKEFVDVTGYSLEEWLKLIKSKESKNLQFINYMFPNDEIREKYLETINSRSEEEVIFLLRKFLITSGSMGIDNLNLCFLIECAKNNKKKFATLTKIEYYKRLSRSYINKQPVWEGITWVIDLLPHEPKHAINSLNAYLFAHIQLLPDERSQGLLDAIAIIRAKFMEMSHPREIFEAIDPYQFEHVVEALYYEMGYTTTMTKKTHDGGKDIIAERKEIGMREKILIQCKKQGKNVNVDKTRALLGVVSDSKATKGVLVTTAEFTPDSKKLVDQNNRIELIGNFNLQKLMNEYFGPKWPMHIDYIISESIKRHKS